MSSVGILKVVTFQVILVSSVHRSFILINYGDIAETKQIWLVSADSSLLLFFANDRNDKELPWLYFMHVEDIKTIHLLLQAGYNTVDSVNSFTIPVTNASELSSSSNINVNGRSSFHVDGSPNCKPMQPENQA